MTGDLKCGTCGMVTQHALLRSGAHRDYAEEYQRLALGGASSDRLTDVDRARKEYRLGLPRNPLLNHRYWVAEARTAWKDGTKAVVALCGEPMELDSDPDGPACSRSDPTALIEPSLIRADQEYEDPETGLWWMELDCVDCLRIANAGRLERQRKLLLTELLEVSALVDTMEAADVAALRDHIARLMAHLR